MTWKDYEQYIHSHFVKLYPDAKITHNAKKLGFLSKVERQIDILIEGTIAGYNLIIVIDCKYFNKKVDVKTVEEFIGFLQDVKANKGVLITNIGYTPAAQNRAINAIPLDLELKIVEFSELEEFQGFGAIVYHNSGGVIVSPPKGWIVDGGRPIQYALATLYAMGQRFEDAFKKQEYMYVWITTKTDIHPNLESLIDYQEKYTKERYHDCEIEYFDRDTGKAKSKLRRITVSEYSALEYTGFIEFDEFIFYCVLVTPKKDKTKNLKKLEHILKEAFPLKVTIEGRSAPSSEDNPLDE